MYDVWFDGSYSYYNNLNQNQAYDLVNTDFKTFIHFNSNLIPCNYWYNLFIKAWFNIHKILGIFVSCQLLKKLLMW